MPFWRLFYHVVWATQYRERRLNSEAEPFVHDRLRGKAQELGSEVFAVNGMPDHVHLVLSIPPRLAVARFVGQLKGYSSTRLNQSGLLDRQFFWQDEYAAFTLDAKRLPHHVAYVDHQKSHHERGTVIPALERTAEEEPEPSTEPAPPPDPDED